MAAHPEEVGRASRLTATELEAHFDDLPHLITIDVRGPGETSEGSIEGSILVPVSCLRDEIEDLAGHKHDPVVAFCAGGYRSSIAASLLRAHGFTDVSDVLGGYSALN